MIADSMQKGELNGATCFGVTSEKEIALFGLEDKALYKKNYDAYRSVMKERERVGSYLKTIDKKLEKQARKVFTVKQKKIQDARDAYNDSNSEFIAYLLLLLNEAANAHYSLDASVWLQVCNEAFSFFAKLLQIDKPRPVPFGFVVKKGEKIFFCKDLAIPGPVSEIDIFIISCFKFFFTDMLILCCLKSLATDLIACALLIIMLKIICVNQVGLV